MGLRLVVLRETNLTLLGEEKGEVDHDAALTPALSFSFSRRERDGQIFTFVASEEYIPFLQAVGEDVRARHYVRVLEVLEGKTRVRRRTIDGVWFGDGEN